MDRFVYLKLSWGTKRIHTFKDILNDVKIQLMKNICSTYDKQLASGLNISCKALAYQIGNTKTLGGEVKGNEQTAPRRKNANDPMNIRERVNRPSHLEQVAGLAQMCNELIPREEIKVRADP